MSDKYGKYITQKPFQVHSKSMALPASKATGIYIYIYQSTTRAAQSLGRVFTAQFGTLFCIRELSKYLDVLRSHLVTGYRHNLLIFNWRLLCLIWSNCC